MGSGEHKGGMDMCKEKIIVCTVIFGAHLMACPGYTMPHSSHGSWDRGARSDYYSHGEHEDEEEEWGYEEEESFLHPEYDYFLHPEREDHSMDGSMHGNVDVDFTEAQMLNGSQLNTDVLNNPYAQQVVNNALYDTPQAFPDLTDEQIQEIKINPNASAANPGELGLPILQNWQNSPQARQQQAQEPYQYHRY